MESEDSSDVSGLSISEDIPNADIASPDPVEDTAQPASRENLLRDDNHSQMPVQDEAAANGKVDVVIGSVQNVDISQTLQLQDVTDAVDTSNISDSEVLKPAVRDDQDELDYDEEVQPDAGPIVNASEDSVSNACQKAADEEEREDGEEKVDY